MTDKNYDKAFKTLVEKAKEIENDLREFANSVHALRVSSAFLDLEPSHEKNATTLVEILGNIKELKEDENRELWERNEAAEYYMEDLKKENRSLEYDRKALAEQLKYAQKNNKDLTVQLNNARQRIKDLAVQLDDARQRNKRLENVTKMDNIQEGFDVVRPVEPNNVDEDPNTWSLIAEWESERADHFKLKYNVLQHCLHDANLPIARIQQYSFDEGDRVYFDHQGLENLKKLPPGSGIYSAPVIDLSWSSHPDDTVAYKFGIAIGDKMKRSREKGRGGWQTCDPENLIEDLFAHLAKSANPDNWLDLACYCMMLHERGINPELLVAKLNGEWLEYRSRYLTVRSRVRELWVDIIKYLSDHKSTPTDEQLEKFFDNLSNPDHGKPGLE